MTILHTPKAGESACSSPPLPTAFQSHTEELPTEALFPEARRRERRRRLFTIAASLLVLVGTAIGVVLSGGTGSLPRQSLRPASPNKVSASSLPSLTHATGFVLPSEPQSLAVGPNGALYVADGNEILVRAANGKFATVAGNGQPGFSGDGGPAIRAEVSSPGGMTFGPNGALYFADSGNGRVRMIAPDGIITTIAGGGVVASSSRSSGLIVTGTPALGAFLGWPTDVAFGPGERLYIADSGNGEILRLDADGTLTVIAGEDGACGGICGIGGAAVRAGTDGPTGIAFDRAGDLFISGDDTKGLLMVTPRGVMDALSEFGFYARGVGGLITAPNGQVIGMTGQDVVSISPDGWHVIYSFANHGFPSDDNAFLPNGIAISPTGTIYLDTTAGNGWTRRSVIAELQPDNQPHVIWES